MPSGKITTAHFDTRMRIPSDAERQARGLSTLPAPLITNSFRISRVSRRSNQTCPHNSEWRRQPAESSSVTF